MVNDAETFKAEDEKQKERISAKNNLESYCFKMTKRRFLTSAMRPSSGWTLINWLRWTSSMTSKRRLKECATQSSLRCTRQLVVLPKACLMAWVVCPVVCQEVCQEEVLHLEVGLDQPSKRLIKDVDDCYEKHLKHLRKNYQNALWPMYLQCSS